MHICNHNHNHTHHIQCRRVRRDGRMIRLKRVPGGVVTHREQANLWSTRGRLLKGRTTAVETTSDERPENAFGLLEYCARARQAIDTIMSLLQSFYDPDVDGVHTHMHTYCAHVCMHTHKQSFKHT